MYHYKHLTIITYLVTVYYMDISTTSTMHQRCWQNTSGEAPQYKFESGTSKWFRTFWILPKYLGIRTAKRTTTEARKFPGTRTNKNGEFLSKIIARNYEDSLYSSWLPSCECGSMWKSVTSGERAVRNDHCSNSTASVGQSLFRPNFQRQ